MGKKRSGRNGGGIPFYRVGIGPALSIQVII